ncbi:peptidase inhibitor family I36 protein [Streptomyces sp. NBC_00250]|uniref:peptidase inhibitor family I36 protein n=1 Tax=Streptomyces sp. NBC_00250 TaxID=2903641 RepID=UPI002E2A7C43|nr:peptidase inhibitor family I36 protein [Streptomyces sp. NBC_00250]
MSNNTGFRRKLAAVATSTALLFGAGIATASTASAGYNCPSGYHCAFHLYTKAGASHQYFTSDPDFTDDIFDVHGADGYYGYGYGDVVNDKVSAASNSSTAGYESHYYRDINYGGGLAFCVNPGSSIGDFTYMPLDQQNVASSLLLRGTTSVHCY